MWLHDLRAWSRSFGVGTLALASWAVGTNPAESRGAGPDRGGGAGPPTYSRDVAPIFRAKCEACHQKGQVGPFALDTYEQARKRSGDIAVLVGDGQMPPWKPAAGIGPKLQCDKSLTLAEVALIESWVEAGAPKGDVTDLPKPVAAPDGWQLGTPDLILQAPEDFAVPASGPDIYRCFVIPTNLPSDTHLAAIEYRPGNRRVVHHMATFLDGRGNGRKLDEADPGLGYTSFTGPGFQADGEIGFWTAGNTPRYLPEGVAISLPARSDLILQVHYHPTGRPETDRTRIGLYFSRGPVKRTMHWNDATNYSFKLPPGRPNIEIKGSWIVPVDVEALAVSPHMHNLGRDMRLSISYPDGRKRDLISIPDWDPAWQDTYYFEKPILLPKGATIDVVAHYDNTAHPRNPNSPPKLVRSGHGVKDEMCVGYIAVVKKDQDLTRPGEVDDLYWIFAKQRVFRLRAVQRKIDDR